MTSSSPRRERSMLAAGATTALLGIGLSADQSGMVPSLLVLGGLVTVIWGLHRFGRTGPDPALVLPTRTKRRRQRAQRD